MTKALRVVSILLAVIIALNFGYAQAQLSYAQTLDEISSRLPYNWHGLDQISKEVIGQSLNGIWGQQEAEKYRYFQIRVTQFASEAEREDARERYEGGQGAWDFASSLAGDVSGNAFTYTSTIAGSQVFTLTSSSYQLQIDRLSISTGIYYDYGIFVFMADVLAESSEVWGEIASLIGEKGGYESAPPTEAEPTPPTEPGPTTEPPTEAGPETGVGEYELVQRLLQAEQGLYDAMLDLVVYDSDGYIAAYSEFFADAIVDCYNAEAEGGYLDQAWAYISGSVTESVERTCEEVLDFFINSDLWAELKSLVESKLGIEVPTWVDDAQQLVAEHSYELGDYLDIFSSEDEVKLGVWITIYAGMRWGAYGDELSALEQAHQEFQSRYSIVDDSTLLSELGDRDKVEEYIAQLESWTQQLGDEGIKEYTFTASLVGGSSFGQVAGAVGEAMQGIDSWGSRKREVDGYEINKLPRSLMGANYFKSCKSIWAVVDIMADGVPGGGSVSFIVNDVGFNGGYIACLLFANKAIEQDIDSMTIIINELLE